MAKGFFGLTFDEVKNNKDSIKKKALSLRKREKVIIIYQRCIIYERSVCKNLKVYYYAFPEIMLKGGTLLTRT